MSGFLMHTEEQLDEVLRRYEIRGITLSRRPAIQYHEAFCPDAPKTMAEIPFELETMLVLTSSVTEELAPYYWRDVCGVDVSREALQELRRSLRERVRAEIASSAAADLAPDITLWAPFRFERDAVRLDTLAHEVWHLYEREQGVRNIAPWIKEGTAVYAANWMSGLYDLYPVEEMTSMDEMLYWEAASIIDRQLEGRGLQTMLDPAFRRQAQDALKRRFHELYPAFMLGSLETDAGKAFARDQLTVHPSFAALQGNLSTGNLLQAHREIGSEKLADELEGQDLSRYLAFLEKIGF